MKILAIHRHYWPDAAPYARILRTIVEDCAANGHETTVLTAQPTYNNVRHPRQPWRETLGRVEVRRIRLLPERNEWRLVRAINFVLFLVRAVLHASFGKPYDLVIASSHPPVLMGCALRIIRALRGTLYIYHCQDLQPEAAAVAGDLRCGWFYERLMRWEIATCRKAHRVVVLSRDMADALAARGLPLDNVCVINNPPLAADPIGRPKLPPPLDDRIDTVRFLFAGKLERFQGLERLVAAARLVAGRVPFQLIFMGDGSAKRELTALAGELLGSRIIFTSHQPLGTALAAMRVCDYGVVSLMASVYRLAYPNECMTYLSAGCPVVTLVEPESDLAQTIQTHELGYVAGSRSVTAIAETIVKAVAESRSWNAERRRRIERTCEEIFGQRRMLDAWRRLIANQSDECAIEFGKHSKAQAA